MRLEITLGSGRAETVPWGGFALSCDWLACDTPFCSSSICVHRTCRAAPDLLASLFQLAPLPAAPGPHTGRTAGVHIVGPPPSDHGWRQAALWWTPCFLVQPAWDLGPRLPDRRSNPRCAQIMHTHVDPTMDDGRGMQFCMMPWRSPRGRSSPRLQTGRWDAPHAPLVLQCGARLAPSAAVLLCAQCGLKHPEEPQTRLSPFLRRNI